MHRCAVLAMLTPHDKKDFDRGRTIRMALVVVLPGSEIMKIVIHFGAERRRCVGNL